MLNAESFLLWLFQFSLPMFNVSFSRRESYQISEITFSLSEEDQQESDYLAIRSGSEPLCDICIRGGSHSHAKRALAVAPALPRRNAL